MCIISTVILGMSFILHIGYSIATGVRYVGYEPEFRLMGDKISMFFRFGRKSRYSVVKVQEDKIIKSRRTVRLGSKK